MTPQVKNTLISWAPVGMVIIVLGGSYGVLYAQVQRQGDKDIAIEEKIKDQARMIEQFRKVQGEIRETQIRSEDRQIRIEERLVRMEEQQRQIFNKSLYLKKDSFSKSSTIAVGSNR